jgi:hypothetical protein
MTHPHLIDSPEDPDLGRETRRHFTDTIDPKLVNNETSTDMKLDLLANQLKVNVHSDTRDKRRHNEEDDVILEEVDPVSASSSDSSIIRVTTEEPPVAAVKPVQQQQQQQGGVSSVDAKRFRKIELLRIFHELEEKGMKISQKYTIHSDLEEMEEEYALMRSIRNKKNTLMIYKSFLMTTVSTMEFLNDAYNPFDFHLNGWSDSVNTNMDSFEEVLGEIYEKYKDTGRKMEPEIKLLLMLVSSASTFHMQKMFLGTFSSNASKRASRPAAPPPAPAPAPARSNPQPPSSKVTYNEDEDHEGSNNINENDVKRFLQRMRENTTRVVTVTDDNNTSANVSTTTRKKKKPGITIAI